MDITSPRPKLAMADPSIARSTRTYILATLLAILAATTLIAMFFVILCPAQVSFVVTDASRRKDTKDNTLSLHLSILANTTSQRHTRVKFERIFIDLFNRPEREDDDQRHWIIAHVNEKALDDYVKYRGNTTIKASAVLPSHTTQYFADENWVISVTVMAQVHFKVGVVRTRLYDIKVYCDGVVFPDLTNKTADRNVRVPCLN